MLFGREVKMEDEKREIVICRWSFGVKCHTVNVKGGDKSWGWWQSLVIMFPPMSLLLCCSLSSLLPSQTCSAVLPLLLILKLCSAKFFTATNISPRGQDLPLHMHARAHAPTPSPLSYTTQLSLFACILKKNWCEDKEREAKLGGLFTCYCFN